MKSDKISSEMKKEFENDVHNFIDLDTTEDDKEVKNTPNIQANQVQEIVSSSTQKNDDQII